MQQISGENTRPAAPVRLFICWSGAGGEEIAEEIGAWLKRIILKDQNKKDKIKPVVSINIDKGELWFNELDKALNGCQGGIICLTAQAVNSPWIHFEAGALSRSLSGMAENSVPRRIFPLLIDVTPEQLSGPLTAYQATRVDDPQDMLRLAQAIGAIIEPSADPSDHLIDPTRFARSLSKLGEGLKNKKVARIQDVFDDIQAVFNRKTFNEPIQECTNQEYAARCDGIRQTLRRLEGRRPIIRSACRECIVDLYEALYRELDAYLMDSSSKRLYVRDFDIDDEGFVQIVPAGLAAACERRRKRVKALLAKLLDWEHLPYHEEAFRFEEAETLEERKSLIHRRIAEWRRSIKESARKELKHYSRTIEQWHEMGWEFDRIMSYVPFAQNHWFGWTTDIKEGDGGPLDWVRDEMLKACAKAGADANQGAASGKVDPRHDASALHYALGALQRFLREQPGAREQHNVAVARLLDSLRDEAKIALPRGMEATIESIRLQVDPRQVERRDPPASRRRRQVSSRRDGRAADGLTSAAGRSLPG